MLEVIGVVVAAIWLAALLALAVRVVVARLRGLRLTDWFFTAGAVAGLVGWPAELFERFGAWATLPLLVGVVVGVAWSQRDIAGYRARPRREPTGAFLFGRPTPGVRNWTELPWRSRPESA